MRVMVAGLALLFIVVTSPSFAQTAQSDSQTLDAILAELREIHHELRSTQAMQMLLAELGAKQSVVNQAVERLDRERSNLIQIQSDQGRTLGELDRAQDKVDRSSDPTEQKQLTEEVQRLKTNISTLKILEQARQSAVDEAQQRLRDSHDAVQEVQEQLDAMTKKLTQGGH